MITAPVPVSVGVFASVNPGGHLYLERLAYPTFAVVLSAGMLAVAGRLGFRPRALRVGVVAVCTVVAAVALLNGLLGSAVPHPFEAARGSVVATSPSHRVVTYEDYFGVTALRVQSRDGWASREGRTDLACFVGDSSEAAPGGVFDGAAFVGPNEIEVVTEDGRAWRLRFNPATLAPESMLDRCHYRPLG